MRNVRRSRFLRRRDPGEADTLRVIMDWLDAKDYLWVRHSPSNVVGKKGQATFRRIRPSQVGAPDILVWLRRYLHAGVVAYCSYAIEVKSSIGKLSEDQEKWRAKAESTGLRYIVARRLEDVSEWIK